MEQEQKQRFVDKIENLRSTDFSHLKDEVYLDHAGSTLYCGKLIQSYHKDLQENLYGNPHSGNSCGAQMSNVINQVRTTIANYFNFTLDEYDVIFTSGATGSLRMVGEYIAWNAGSYFAYLEDNHTSVVGIRELAGSKGAAVVCLSPKMTQKHFGCDLKHYTSNQVKVARNSSDASDTSACLFAFPAQSNFSGKKYPLSWINDLQHPENTVEDIIGCGDSNSKRNWYVLCDAASYIATSFLDLHEYPADFVPVSFYKIFGFPTGLGALLVKKTSSARFCDKVYFGGGSVSGWLATEDYFSPKSTLHDRFEDGSLPFLSILAVKHAFDTFKQIGLFVKMIQPYTFGLVHKCYNALSYLQHYNGFPVVKTYGISEQLTTSNQGPILAFNVLRADGAYVGYNHVLELAYNEKIHMRGGCFCNVGACASLLGISSEELLKSYKDGHVCGDKIDMIMGKPIGALRISFGYCSTASDVEKLISFISRCFQEVHDENEVFYDAVSDVEESCSVMLEKIIVYPVKSCQGFEVDSWEIGPTGLLYDRTWMIVDHHSVSLTLKKEPKLILISPTIDLKNQTLRLSAHGRSDIDVPLIRSDSNLDSMPAFQTCTSRVCNDTVDTLYCGDEASQWLTDLLGYECHLLQKHLGTDRLGKNSHGVGMHNISLANEAQYLMVNQGSVEFLMRRIITDSGHGCIEESLAALAKRFRSNFVISGCPPFAEDAWTEFTIRSSDDDVDFSVIGRCNRCSMICINPATGEKVAEPLKTLAKVKTSDNKKRIPTFGVYLKCQVSSGAVTTKSAIAFK